eukprot:6997963-Alexandrium_andersonii.AAC.1
MLLLHPSRNSSPDADEAMKVLYSLWYELHLRRAAAGKGGGGEMPPPAFTRVRHPPEGGAAASLSTLGAAS